MPRPLHVAALALLMTIALLAATVAAAPSAFARLYGPVPMNVEEEPIYDFTCAAALHMELRSHIEGGAVGVVDGDVEDPSQANCEHPAWGGT